MSDIVTDGDIGGVVEDMQKSEAIARAGQPFTVQAALGDDAPPPPEPAEIPSPADLGVTVMVPDNSALIRALPPETVDASRSLRPGLTVRGWSPEVTARHPDMLIEAMEELGGGGGGATAEPIDPTDPVALSRARSAFDHLDQIKVGLQNSAIKLNFMRLVQGLRDAGQESPVAQAANAEAIEEAKALTGDADVTGAPVTSTSDPAPLPTATPTTTRTTTRTTSTSTDPATTPPA